MWQAELFKNSDTWVVTDPLALRFSITGNVLGLPTPKASLVANFKALPVSKLRLVLYIADKPKTAQKATTLKMEL